MITEHVAQWTNRQREQFRLCDVLDQMAERLPLFEVQACEEVVSTMHSTLSSAHAYEERELFPRLEASSSQIGGVLAIFRTHHAEDRAEAVRIASLIADMAERGAMDVIAQLKVQIPLFARSLRRNVQFEQAICRALFASTKSSTEQAGAVRRMAS
jgi:hypothetical protein